MDLPKPPEDQDLKNIIDKLAQFVARNGPEFEQMTKNKQKDNKKFSFLFGGEFFNYYQYKVTTEQAILKQKVKVAEQQQVQTQSQGTAPTQPQVAASGSDSSNSWQNSALPEPVSVQASASNPAPVLTEKRLQVQIQESELNLNAQHQVLLQQQQAQIEEAVHKMQEEKLKNLTAQCDFSVNDLDVMLEPIIESCTKEAISNGKSWIFVHAQNEKNCEAISSYLLRRVISSEAEFDLKLHIIYLVNDVIHHSVRKNNEYLKKALDSVVVPVFCNASLGADEEREKKLSKLLTLWETNEYFPKDVIEQLKQPASSLANYQASLITEHASVVQPIVAAIQVQLSNLQKQHNDFVAHVNAQISAIQSAPMNLPQNPLPPMELNNQEGIPIPSTNPPENAANMFPMNGGHQQSNNSGMLFPDHQQNPPYHQQSFNQPFPPNQPIHSFNEPQFNQPPMGGPPGPVVPDFSRPPPGFPPHGGGPPIPGLPPVPYHELPAALMVPLIKLDDEYTPIDSSEIRLPPPTPPSERLLNAVEAFYLLPSHERPRNGEGWEQLGLYEHFKAKSFARRRRQEMVKANSDRMESYNDSPGRHDNYPYKKDYQNSSKKHQRRNRPKSPPRRRYRESVSPERKKPSPRNRSRSPSPCPYLRHSRSRSPSPRRRSRSRSLSPVRKRTSRSRSRSTTPPSFFGSTYGNPIDDRKLDESNKGHQLLKRMGWGGAGLGASEQGRQDPVNAGDVRDKQDLYKGIGINLNDPFENFRKTKGQAFITRMKARAEESGKV